MDETTDAAREDRTLMILGETGTGKEVIARGFHHASPHAKGPFVALNCAAIPKDLAEAELFGATRGAYSGATAARDVLALALEDFATLAEEHRKEMDGLGAFDVGLIDEARTLANELRALPTAPALASVASRAALAKRNRLLQLLQARVNLIRGATRFVFRTDDTMVRKVTSAFERKRRAQARRAAMKKEAPGNGAAVGATGAATAGGAH